MYRFGDGILVRNVQLFNLFNGYYSQSMEYPDEMNLLLQWIVQIADFHPINVCEVNRLHEFSHCEFQFPLFLP